MDSFAQGRGIRAADLNRLASDASRKGIAGSAYLAHSNGFELVQRNPRRAARGGRAGAVRCEDFAVVVSTNVAEAGPRAAAVRDPVSGETRQETVCPVEIAEQFAVAGRESFWVVAVRVPCATATDDRVDHV